MNFLISNSEVMLKWHEKTYFREIEVKPSNKVRLHTRPSGQIFFVFWYVKSHFLFTTMNACLNFENMNCY